MSCDNERRDTRTMLIVGGEGGNIIGKHGAVVDPGGEGGILVEERVDNSDSRFRPGYGDVERSSLCPIVVKVVVYIETVFDGHGN